MPFHRFEELISTSHLHFHSLSELEDKFEGTFSLDPTDAPPIWYPRIRGEKDDLDRIINPISAEMTRFHFHANERPITYVNCWTLRRSECTAMWSVYLKGNPGIALRTSLGRFEAAFNESDEWVSAAKAVYIDHLAPAPARGTRSYPGIQKSLPYQWESGCELSSFRSIPTIYRTSTTVRTEWKFP
jgi:hypothetical protein